MYTKKVKKPWKVVAEAEKELKSKGGQKRKQNASGGGR